MVGAQNAMKIASNFFPLRKSTSDAIIMETTTKSRIQFINPTLSTKFLSITNKRNIFLAKLRNKVVQMLKKLGFF